MNIGENDFKNLIIYTGIYSDGGRIYSARSEIWPDTFHNAEELGITIVVRNDGVPEQILEKLKRFKNLFFVNKDKPCKLGAGRRLALQEAIRIAKERNIENPVFLWIEPEKDKLITKENLSKIMSEIRNGSNIVLADRGEKAWNQLPSTQRWLEKRANERVGKINNLDTKLDWWFSPKAFDLEGAEYFLKYNPDNKKMDLWDATMVPVVDAIKEGKKVSSVPVDFLYNNTQIENETDELNIGIKVKRIEQYALILKEFGDSKWEDFFNSAKKELEKIKELQKNDIKRDAPELKEAKAPFLSKIFKLK